MSVALPVLPDGYFWRLSSDSFGFMMVSIRQERKRFGSREIAYSLVLEDAPVSSAVYSAADRALAKWDEQEGRLDFLRAFRKLEGDYK